MDRALPVCSAIRYTCTCVSTMKELKELWRLYGHYFLDIWQYLVIIIGFIIAALIFL